MSSRTNERGNIIVDEFTGPFAERYQFDREYLAAGFKQWDTDQDASYFGVWVHVETRVIVTFAEGDLSTVTCPTDESFKAEIANMRAFYGDVPRAFAILDPDAGTLTNVHVARPA